MVNIQSMSKIEKIVAKLDEIGINSYADYEKLNENNVLDFYLKNSGFEEPLKREITLFLKNLYNQNIPPTYKKILLDSYLKNIDIYAQKLISMYYKNDKAYRNLPIFIKMLIDNLNIVEFKQLTEDDLYNKLKECLDIKEWRKNYNQGGNDTIEVVRKFINPKYEENQQRYLNPIPNYLDKDEFYIWGEYQILKNEEVKPNDLSSYPPLWVAKDFGDGYGFDIISYNRTTKREALIEVKTGLSRDTILSANEYNVMRNCHLYNADYYIVKYYYDQKNRELSRSIFKYIQQFDALIDVETYEEYRISCVEFANDYTQDIDKKYQIVKVNMKQLTAEEPVKKLTKDINNENNTNQ